MTVPPNRRLVALVGAAAVALVVLVLVVRSCGGSDDAPPKAGAEALVPDKTLVFASLSTDGEREAVGRAADIAQRFGGYAGQRDALLTRLSGDDRKVDPAKDVEPWLGDEAAFALMDTGQSQAGSLVAIEVTDQDAAKTFLERNPREAVRRVYKEHETLRYGQVTTAFVGDYMVIGQDPTVQMAIDREKSGAKSLEDDPVYQRATEGMADGRVLSAYASADGLRRLLAPQGDALGALAATLDQPGLQGVSLAAEAEEDDKTVRLRVHSALDAAAQKRTPSPFKTFEPQLLDAAPEGSLGYLGVSGISGALQRLILSAVGGTTGGGDVTQLLGRLRTELDKETGGGLQRDLLKLFEGEVALVIQRATPAPIFSIVTEVEDEDATRSTLDKLRAPLARLLRPEGEPELKWSAVDIEGNDGWTLTLPTGAAITYAVAEGRLILSTRPEGVANILKSDDALADSDIFEDVLGDRPESVGTLGFLDFSQLLELGEQTGLNDSRAYLAARDDLHKVRAVGVSSTSSEGESTAEILVSIP